MTMPAVFVGHGSPMNAIEDNEFSRAWAELGTVLPRPEAILCISAHWETDGTQVTAMEKPRTIHDFGGFPQELYEINYPAPGSANLAREVQTILAPAAVSLDQTWGLDHGTWSVLSRMYPSADIPVVQLSLDRGIDPTRHYALGKMLRELRNRRVLIMGSGNVVHNLGLVIFEDIDYDWATAFDATVKQLILSDDHDALVNYHRLGRGARLAIPTNEHYLPVLYVLAVQDPGESLRFFSERVTYGSLSMRSVVVG